MGRHNLGNGSGVRRQAGSRRYVGDRTFRFVILLNCSIGDRDGDFIFPKDKVVAILESDCLIAGNPLFGVVEEGAIGAGVREDIAAILVMDDAMFAGQDAFGILEDPVVLRRTADADRTAIQGFGRLLAGGESLVAGDGQFQGHGAMSVGEGVSTVGFHRMLGG